MSRREIAEEFWGTPLPDWIDALVAACDAPRSSQNKVAARLGLSAPTISQTIRKRYAGDIERIRDRICAVYLSDQVTCPALGVISGETCLIWRDRAAELVSAAPLTVQMFRACRDCPRYRSDDEEEDHGAD